MNRIRINNRKLITPALLMTAAVVLVGCNDEIQQRDITITENPSRQFPGVETPAPVVPENDVPVNAAVATLLPTAGSEVSGEVRFYAHEGMVMVEANVTGLDFGSHGIHIHETGDFSAEDASSAGEHFAPQGSNHGSPDNPADQRHAGDLGNVVATVTGMAQYDHEDSVIALDGPDSIIGKAVIIHAGEDDLMTQPSGDSGSPVACGVIQSAKEGVLTSSAD
jgi:Cu-Zn family superoxide dismutase